MNFKKRRRYLKFLLKIYVLKFINFFLKKYHYNILPKIDKNKISNIQYSKKSNTYYINSKKNKINIYRFDTSNVFSELCKLGRKYNSDKSPYSKTWHRHGYTGFYDLLFSSFKNDKFNFAEIGVYKNSSMQMFRNYFKNATLYGFDNNKKLLNRAKKQKIKNTNYLFIDVRNENNIYQTFYRIKKKFKIIIDDSSHDFDDQIKIIKNCLKFLEPGGYLVIEDIFMFDGIEQRFINKLGSYFKFFIKFDFIELNHINQFSSGWITNNDKILIIQKKF
jgi:SAM-dependent methyltransferase